MAITLVCVKGEHSCNYFVADHGKILTFGSNSFGQLGVGEEKFRPVPQIVPVDDNPQTQLQLVSLACGWNHVLTLSSDGRLYSWGRADLVSDFLVAASAGRSAPVKLSSFVSDCDGSITKGQQGDGTTSGRRASHEIVVHQREDQTKRETFIEIACGSEHSIAWTSTSSHHITPHHITSHHITPHHITSHHTTPHHITSHHTTPHSFDLMINLQNPLCTAGAGMNTAI